METSMEQTTSSPQHDPIQEEINARIARLESLELGALLERKEALTRLGNGVAGAMSDADLAELCHIFGLLRRRSSGPPKTKTAAKKSAEKKPLEALL
jgi:hypothetical protein